MAVRTTPGPMASPANRCSRAESATSPPRGATASPNRVTMSDPVREGSVQRARMRWARPVSFAWDTMAGFAAARGGGSRARVEVVDRGAGENVRFGRRIITGGGHGPEGGGRVEAGRVRA